MMRATELAHLAVRQSLQAGDWAVDATVGNGHDTLLLAELVGPTGSVIGFDVQEAALEAAGAGVAGLPQVTLLHTGHENLGESLPGREPPSGRGGLAAVMFNLGYLPGAPKTVVTRTETTLAALEQALGHLAPRGLVTLVLYPGHPGGDEEAVVVRSYARGLGEPFAVTQYARLNSMTPSPELLVIERLG